jgi:hypothetical protein
MFEKSTVTLSNPGINSKPDLDVALAGSIRIILQTA